MDILIIFLLCALAVAKVTLQSRFSKKYMKTSVDALKFNAFIFFTVAIIFLKNIFNAPAQIWTYATFFAFFTSMFQFVYSKALAIGSVSLTVMIVNLSMLFPVILSVTLYDEKMMLPRFLGIVLTVISFVLCIEVKSKNLIGKKWFVVASLAMLSNGGIGVTQKIFGESMVSGERESFIGCSYLLAFFITTAICAFAQKKEQVKSNLQLKLLVISAMIGGILALFQFLNTFAITTIDGTLLFPMYSGGSIIFSTFVGLVAFKDKINCKQIISIFIGIIAIILMNF